MAAVTTILLLNKNYFCHETLFTTMEQNFGINNVTVHPGIIKAHGNQATNCKECDRLGMRHVQGREEMYCAIW